MSYNIEIKKVPAIRVASLWARGLPFNVTVPKAYEELAEWISKKKIPMHSGSPMGLALYYDDPKEVKPEDVRFKVAVPVSKETPLISEGRAEVEELPAYEVAYLTIRGPYTNLEDAYKQLFGWVYKSGYRIIDASREVYVSWGEQMPPEEWITEIQAPIEMMNKYKAIFHLNESDRAKLTLGNIRNLLQDLGESEVEVELLANSDGVKALLKTGSFEKVVTKLKDQGVRFAVCSKTLEFMNLTKEAFLEPVEVVSSGSGELVRRQAEGWAYIKP